MNRGDAACQAAYIRAGPFAVSLVDIIAAPIEPTVGTTPIQSVSLSSSVSQSQQQLSPDLRGTPIQSLGAFRTAARGDRARHERTSGASGKPGRSAGQGGGDMSDECLGEGKVVQSPYLDLPSPRYSTASSPSLRRSYRLRQHRSWAQCGARQRGVQYVRSPCAAAKRQRGCA